MFVLFVADGRGFVEPYDPPGVRSLIDLTGEDVGVACPLTLHSQSGQGQPVGTGLTGV